MRIPPTPEAAPVSGSADWVSGDPHAAPSTSALLARTAGENFPVAARLLPREVRGHLLAVYGFARLVDDIGDEASGDRGALLDLVEEDLGRVPTGTARLPLLQRLAPTVRVCEIPLDPFHRLIAANRQDQVVTRYATWEELRGYCALSANPVGEIVLHVLGTPSDRQVQLSDDVCTALQLLEHLQDVREDFSRGRVYLPGEDMVRFGCTEADLRAPSAGPALRRLVRFEVERASGLLDAGTPVVAGVPGLARVALAGFVAGGRSAAAGIVAARCDVLPGPPPLRRSTLLSTWCRLMMMGVAR